MRDNFPKLAAILPVLTIKILVMRTNKNTLTGPELFIDDHHGQYMGQYAWQQLAERYKEQARKKLSKKTIEDLEGGPEMEFHHEACDRLTNITFKTPTGQKWSLQYADGGIWVIPACFLRSKAANEFFGN